MNSESKWETTSSEYGLSDGEYVHWIATMCVTDQDSKPIDLKPIDVCAENLHNCHKDATCVTVNDSQAFKCNCVNKMADMGLIVVGNGVGENGCQYTIESKPQNIYGSNYKPSFGTTSGPTSASSSGSTSGSTSGQAFGSSTGSNSGSSTDPTSGLTSVSSGDSTSSGPSGAFNSINEDFIISFTFDSPYETNSKPDNFFIYHQSPTKMTFSEAFHYCARQGLR